MAEVNGKSGKKEKGKPGTRNRYFFKGQYIECFKLKLKRIIKEQLQDIDKHVTDLRKGNKYLTSLNTYQKMQEGLEFIYTGKYNFMHIVY